MVKHNDNEQSIRVDIDRLDHLMNLIGELVLSKNRLIKINNDVEERYEGEPFLEELNQIVSTVSLVTTDLQIAVMKTRMLQIGNVFNKFPKLITDISKDKNKIIDLKILGEETELDKSILEELTFPLTEIIKNSVFHGIDSKEERQKFGKKLDFTIEIKAFHEGNNIIITITDDGKGIDTKEIVENLIRNNDLLENDLKNLTDKEILNLLFKIENSGLFKIKNKIEELKGIVEIESEFMKYTSIKLKIPLTLAIIQSLLVNVQNEIFAIPLNSVLETVNIEPKDIYKVEGKSVTKIREDVLALISLKDIFEVEETYQNNDILYVVIIEILNKKIGILVDNLIGQEEIVIKSMGEYLNNIEGISGATIRGDGNICLIIDTTALLNMNKNVKSSDSTLKELDNSINKEKRILIIDDSKTDRHIMRNALKDLNIEIDEAIDGIDGLEKIKQKDYSCVLIDIEMPRMDGYTLAENIKKLLKYKNLPLIAVTSRNSKNDRMRGIESGINEYVTKPYSQDYLSNIVKKILKL